MVKDSLVSSSKGFGLTSLISTTQTKSLQSNFSIYKTSITQFFPSTIIIFTSINISSIIHSTFRPSLVKLMVCPYLEKKIIFYHTKNHVMSAYYENPTNQHINTKKRNSKTKKSILSYIRKLHECPLNSISVILHYLEIRLCHTNTNKRNKTRYKQTTGRN